MLKKMRNYNNTCECRDKDECAKGIREGKKMGKGRRCEVNNSVEFQRVSSTSLHKYAVYL
jgi:hypothetical protein